LSIVLAFTFTQKGISNLVLPEGLFKLVADEELPEIEKE
jgi:hypothetical protein